MLEWTDSLVLLFMRAVVITIALTLHSQLFEKVLLIMAAHHDADRIEAERMYAYLIL